MIELRLLGTRAKAPASIVEPLLISDLPVFLRWRGEPPWGAPELEQLVDLTDRLIVDSTEWDDVPYPYRHLVQLFERTAVSDIAWARTSRWRMLLASLWPGIADVRTIRVRGTAAQAQLLAGWLRSRLDRDDIALEHVEAERLEAVELDGEPAPFPPGRSAAAERRAVGGARPLHPRPRLRGRGARDDRLKESARSCVVVWMIDELEALYRARLPEFRRVAAAIAGDRELGLRRGAGGVCEGGSRARAASAAPARSRRGCGGSSSTRRATRAARRPEPRAT